MRTSIKINGLRVYSNHGCLDEEGVIGTYYVFNAELWCDYSAAADQDNLELTIDYVRVREIAEEIIKVRAKLIETILKRVAEGFKKEFTLLDEMALELIKVSPPMGGEVESVSVTWQEKLS